MLINMFVKHINFLAAHFCQYETHFIWIIFFLQTGLALMGSHGIVLVPWISQSYTSGGAAEAPAASALSYFDQEKSVLELATPCFV